ncbi:MAG TPA: hypothetical protein VF490_00700, partial [Chryseosolibacter sp.]
KIFCHKYTRSVLPPRHKDTKGYEEMNGFRLEDYKPLNVHVPTTNGQQPITNGQQPIAMHALQPLRCKISQTFLLKREPASSNR